MSERITDIKHILFNGIKSQRERLEALAKSCLDSIEKRKGTKKARSRPSIMIMVEGLEGDAKQFPQRIKGDLRNVNIGLSYALQSQSLSSSLKAASAWRKENLKESLSHLLQAERLLGQATALSELDQLQSAIAQANAQLSHAETRRMRDKVVKHWREKMNPGLSAEVTAGEMVGIFHWKDGTDVAHRTLAKWIAEARKNGPRPK